MMKLSNEQKDVLLEVCNVGMSKAAKQLSMLLNGPVLLKNPGIEFLTSKDLLTHQFDEKEAVMSMVHQGLTHDFEGHAVLVFKRDYTERLLEAVIGEVPNLNETEIRSCEQEAMLEIGNIVISSCVTALVDMLSQKVGLTVPNYYEGRFSLILDNKDVFLKDKDLGVVVLSTMMSTEKGHFSGHLMLLISPDSTRAILNAVDNLLKV